MHAPTAPAGIGLSININQSLEGLERTEREGGLNPSPICIPFHAIKDIWKRASACYFNCTNRPVRNCINLSCAGGLTVLGSLIAGDLAVRACLHISSVNAAVRIGTGFSGLGNVWSTWAECENDSDDRFTTLERQNALLMVGYQEAMRRIQILEEVISNGEVPPT